MRAMRSSLLLLGLLGCGEAPDGPPGQSTAAVSYRHDAAPLLLRYCTDCHREGGIGPMALNSFASASGSAAAIKAAVASGRMPPWMPSEEGLPLRFSRGMRGEDRALLQRWVDTGAKEGDATETARTDIPAAETAPALPREDLTVDPGFTYMPLSGRADDYRCFLFDPKLGADAWITAANVLPDNKAIVHHVLLFEIPASEAEALRKKDGADGTPGYTCFGGPGSSSPQTVMGWAPGGVPMRTPEGTALKLQKGSLLSMQVHYNLQSYQGIGDRTKVVLELSSVAPKRIMYNVPFANPRALKIAAGDAAASQTVALPLGTIQQFLKLPVQDMIAYGSAPHMHLLGTRITVSVSGGPVLVDLPRWDFHWQQSYAFREPQLIRKGDVVVVECKYDNSAQHQPVINGQQQPPRAVTWGEGTSDEMCLSFLSLIPALP